LSFLFNFLRGIIVRLVSAIGATDAGNARLGRSMNRCLTAQHHVTMGDVIEIFNSVDGMVKAIQISMDQKLMKSIVHDGI
jgi:hypothetical protein